MMRYLFRHYRARARLAARKARGEQILKDMRDNWQIKMEWSAPLQWNNDSPGRKAGDYAGSVILVGEQNDLGERRLRMVKNDSIKWDPEREWKKYAEAVRWREGLSDEDEEEN
jgi:hypothetical protein